MTSQHPKIVYWSEEDRCYIGQCPTLFGGGVHGANELKVYRALRQVVAEWEGYSTDAQAGRRSAKPRPRRRARG